MRGVACEDSAKIFRIMSDASGLAPKQQFCWDFTHVLKFSREYWNSRDCLAPDARIFGANDRVREIFGKWGFHANFDVHATVCIEKLSDAFDIWRQTAIS